MTSESGTPESDTGGSGAPIPGRSMAGLLLLFVGSGAAALVYEVVWFQMLQLVVGASGVSLAILLGTFMGGMCLGSLMLPRLAPLRWHPLRVYGGLELGIGGLALVLMVLIPAVPRVYGGLVPPGLSSVFARAVICGLLLVPPTVLMGATLPAIARQVEATPRGVSWMGFFYAGNIVGAVAGSLLAGFWWLRLYDVRTATLAGVTINVAVALAAFGLSRVLPYSPAPEGGVSSTRPRRVPGSRTVHVAIALSGLAALGAEVVWTRLLSLLLGTTTYTFSIILAVFLAGLGGGSGLGSWLAGRVRSPRYWFAAFQLLAAASVAWTAYALGAVLVYQAVPPETMASPLLLFRLDLARAAFAMLPATVCWGASFPLAVAALARVGDDPGRLLGGVYASNTLGAIVGALGVGLLLVPTVGTFTSMQLVLIVSVVAAAVLWIAAPPLPRDRGGRARLMGGASWLTASVLLLALAGTMTRTPDVLLTMGRHAPGATDPGETLFLGEGLAATVAVTQHEDSIRSFRIQGKVAASNSADDMVLQRMLGHFSALLQGEPKTVLVVGFGAGVTAGTFVTHPSIERIVICEIEALTTEHIGAFFAEENHHVLDDPRIEIIHDDARHFLLTTDETFDVITSDPIHPWVKGAASLYTTEYFLLARKHLSPGGVITQWVPLYESTLDAVRSELATFFDAFPEGTAWSSHLVSRGFDLVLAARPDGLTVDVGALERTLSRPEYSGVRTSLGRVGFNSVDDIARAYAGRGRDLSGWLTGAELNRDRNLRLMYLAGLGLNATQPGEIHAEIQRYRIFPEGLIVAESEALAELRRTMAIDIR